MLLDTMPFGELKVPTYELLERGQGKESHGEVLPHAHPYHLAPLVLVLALHVHSRGLTLTAHVRTEQKSIHGEVEF